MTPATGEFASVQCTSHGSHLWRFRATLEMFHRFAWLGSLHTPLFEAKLLAEGTSLSSPCPSAASSRVPRSMVVVMLRAFIHRDIACRNRRTRPFAWVHLGRQSRLRNAERADICATQVESGASIAVPADCPTAGDASIRARAYSLRTGSPVLTALQSATMPGFALRNTAWPRASSMRPRARLRMAEFQPTYCDDNHTHSKMSATTECVHVSRLL